MCGQSSNAALGQGGEQSQPASDDIALFAVNGFDTGGHLRLQGQPRGGPEQVASRLQLPIHLHPRRHEPGGEVNSAYGISRVFHLFHR